MVRQGLRKNFFSISETLADVEQENPPSEKNTGSLGPSITAYLRQRFKEIETIKLHIENIQEKSGISPITEKKKRSFTPVEYLCCALAAIYPDAPLLFPHGNGLDAPELQSQPQPVPQRALIGRRNIKEPEVLPNEKRNLAEDLTAYKNLARYLHEEDRSLLEGDLPLSKALGIVAAYESAKNDKGISFGTPPLLRIVRHHNGVATLGLSGSVEERLPVEQNDTIIYSRCSIDAMHHIQSLLSLNYCSHFNVVLHSADNFVTSALKTATDLFSFSAINVSVASSLESCEHEKAGIFFLPSFDAHNPEQLRELLKQSLPFVRKGGHVVGFAPIRESREDQFSLFYKDPKPSITALLRELECFSVILRDEHYLSLSSPLLTGETLLAPSFSPQKLISKMKEAREHCQEGRGILMIARK